MAFETKLPHNLVVQSKVTIKWWIQDTIVVPFHCYVGKKKPCSIGQVMLDLANQQPKYRIAYRCGLVVAKFVF
jgi:hypothetical protein